MTERELLHLLAVLDREENTIEDWRDLYETIEAYKRRRLARAIARHPQREEIVATIRALAQIQ
jgi:hypothetical protein